MQMAPLLFFIVFLFVYFGEIYISWFWRRKISSAGGISFVFVFFSFCVCILEKWLFQDFAKEKKNHHLAVASLLYLDLVFFVFVFWRNVYFMFCRKKEFHHLAVASLNPKLLAAQSFPSSQLMLLMGKLEASPGKLFSFLPNQYLNLYLYLYLYFVFTKVVSCRPGESKRALYADRSL